MWLVPRMISRIASVLIPKMYVMYQWTSCVIVARLSARIVLINKTKNLYT